VLLKGRDNYSDVSSRLPQSLSTALTINEGLCPHYFLYLYIFEGTKFLINYPLYVEEDNYGGKI
jgi:hypothetical protein